MKKIGYSVVLTTGLLFAGMGSAQAGQYSDILARCLVNAAGEQDNIVMLKWIYAVLGTNKDLQGLNDVSETQRKLYAKQVGIFFTRAYQETCKSQVADATLFEGQSGVSHAGEVFGASVMSKVFRDPSVLSAMKEIQPFIASKSSASSSTPNGRTLVPPVISTLPSNTTRDSLPTY